MAYLNSVGFIKSMELLRLNLAKSGCCFSLFVSQLIDFPVNPFQVSIDFGTYTSGLLGFYIKEAK